MRIVSVRPEVLAYWEKHWPAEEVAVMVRVAGAMEKCSRKKRAGPRVSDQFVKSPEWKAVRASAIDLYGPICMKCGAESEIQVDHIKPKSKYPELALELSNLQILCWPCNKEKWHKQSEEDYRFIASPLDPAISGKHE
jgi:5-methylcytosine-specific restriction endonuclease McrA